MTQRRTKRTYSEEQKKQLVELYKHGKPRNEIIREYDLYRLAGLREVPPAFARKLAHA